MISNLLLIVPNINPYIVFYLITVLIVYYFERKALGLKNVANS